MSEIEPKPLPRWSVEDHGSAEGIRVAIDEGMLELLVQPALQQRRDEVEQRVAEVSLAVDETSQPRHPRHVHCGQYVAVPQVEVDQRRLADCAQRSNVSGQRCPDAVDGHVNTPSPDTPSPDTPSLHTPSLHTPSPDTPCLHTPSLHTPSLDPPRRCVAQGASPSSPRTRLARLRRVAGHRCTRIFHR